MALSDDHLPAVFHYRRAIEPGALGRIIPRGGLVPDHHGGRVARRLLVVGVRIRQSTAAQEFALWAIYADATGTLIPAATATSGALTAGQWNYVPLSAPIPLAIGARYGACTGFSGSFPATNYQFGSGEPYAEGIASGSLTAFSDQSGSLPAPFSMPQGVFDTAGTDPTVNMPALGANSANFWMDIQVTDTAPAGTSYRLWPNYPTIPHTTNFDNLQQTFGTEFMLNSPCILNTRLS